MKFGNFAINLNTKCNLRCTYCMIPHGDKTGNEISYITLTEFRKFVQKFGEKKAQIDVFGTEPMISWDKLTHLIQICKLYGWTIGITTNATLLTPSRAVFLAENKVRILVSYDGSRRSHNRFRVFQSGQGSWRKVAEGIEMLRQAGAKYACAMTVSPENVPYLLHNVKSAASRGFEYIALNPQFTIGEEPHPTGYDWEVFREKYREAARWAIEHEIPLKFTLEAFKSYSEGKQFHADKATCGAAKGSIAIDWDGKAYICHRACGRKEFHIGDIFGPDYINPQIVMAYRMMDVNDCHYCPIFTQRGSCGHCWTLALDLTGNKNHVPDVVCMWQSIIHDIDMDLYKINSEPHMISSESL